MRWESPVYGRFENVHVRYLGLSIFNMIIFEMSRIQKSRMMSFSYCQHLVPLPHNTRIERWLGIYIFTASLQSKNFDKVSFLSYMIFHCLSRASFLSTLYQIMIFHCLSRPTHFTTRVIREYLTRGWAMQLTKSNNCTGMEEPQSALKIKQNWPKT